MSSKSKSKILFVSDIDGTLIPPKNPFGSEDLIDEFNTTIKKNKNIILVYATGRHLKLILKAIEEGKLIEPKYIISDVGTKIYHKQSGKWKKDKGYREILAEGWSKKIRQQIPKIVANISGLEAQEKSKQSEFKQSYYISLNTDYKKRVVQIKQKLSDFSIDANVIFSTDQVNKIGLIDILPDHTSKVMAINYVKGKLNLKQRQVIYAGDSGNDLDVVTSGIRSIVVGNVQQEFKQKLNNYIELNYQSKKIYLSQLYYAAGVLEGLRHFKIVSKVKKDKKLYIQLYSIHGLFRGKNLELGKDEDTGGQILYVLELAKAIALDKSVGRVDIITRRIADKDYPGYSKVVEKVNSKVNIIRISCGPQGYIKKIKLWSYLDEMVDNSISYMSLINCKPDILHTNYADAGYMGVELSKKLSIPQVHTSHSLGKIKMKRLGLNKKNYAEMDKIYNFSIRIKAEQAAIDSSKAIIVSSKFEKNKHYEPYKINPQSKKFKVVRPGINYGRLYSYKLKNKNSQVYRSVQNKIKQSLVNQGKPLILSLSRLDKRKNILALVKAFAQSKYLIENTRLVLAIGPLKNLDLQRQAIADELIDLIKSKNLNEQIGIIEELNQKETVEFYRIAAKSGGVFVNPALTEPFGLTILEAAACGLPVVGTKNGGPKEILHNLKNGEIFDPQKPNQIAKHIRHIIKQEKEWKVYSDNGLKNIKKYYSWWVAAKKQIKIFKQIID